MRIPCAASDLVALELFAERFQLAGLRVLEIGGRLSEARVRELGVESWTSVDPSNMQGGSECTFYRTLSAYSEDIPLPSNSFDICFSANAFEHFHDLESSLLEIHRVLRPNSFLFSHFGPIWSAPDGHHLETVIGGRPYNFWQHNMIPRWMHLLVDEDEMSDVLSTRLHPSVAAAISRHIYRDTSINRMLLSDYLRVVDRSPFRVCQFEGTPEIDYDFDPPTYPHEKFEQIYRDDPHSLLVQRYPEQNFDWRDLLFILQTSTK